MRTLKNHKNLVCRQYWSGSPKNHKATKPEFNVGPSSARQRNAIQMAFRWQADDGLLLVVFGSSLLNQKKKKKPLSKLDPLLKNLMDPRMTAQYWLAPKNTSRRDKLFVCPGRKASTQSKNKLFFMIVYVHGP